jgi:hypothetical protein
VLGAYLRLSAGQSGLSLRQIELKFFHDDKPLPRSPCNAAKSFHIAKAGSIRRYG